MKKDILVLNSGSSSIKFGLYDGDLPELPMISHGQITGIGGSHTQLTAYRSEDGEILIEKTLGDNVDHGHAMSALVEWGRQREVTRDIVAIGHRVVHGGMLFDKAVIVTPSVLEKLETLDPLAPLHQPHNLAGIRTLSKLVPELPQVACFDTAFHHKLPLLAQQFALPERYYETGIRRYGFHGLSYEYISSVLADVVGAKIASGKVIVAHLGNGASMCALYDRKSIDTTMGFTALDGLPMGTRCGNLDPGIVLYLQNEMGMTTDDVSKLLYNKSGLLGVSGISNNMQKLLASDEKSARNAIDLYVYRINRELGALVSTLGGLDALVFTAGIGEHSSEIRKRVCVLASWLGFEIDDDANQQHDLCISTKESTIPVWVIPTNEEGMIAQHTRHLLNSKA